MKIAYDEIISKANARKDVLMQIEALVNKAPTVLPQACELFEYLNECDAAIKALDAEGRALLPVPVREFLAQSNSIKGTVSVLIHGSHHGYVGLTSLMQDGL